ncbi:MAG: carboxymuconolactone decarboxylase family protein [Dehalococcoidia bacterium]
MARIPSVTRESIREDLRGVFDEINAGPGGIGTGPMSVLKHSPELAKRAIPLFEYVRNESTVPLQIRELAMLTTARAKDSPYIWNRHVSLARESGLKGDLIDALRDRKPLPPRSALEEAVINLGLDFFQSNQVSQQTFDVILEHLGAQGLVELTTLMGFYAMLAFNANAVDLGMPAIITEPPLPV